MNFTAYAQEAGAAGASSMMNLLPFVLIMVIFYFLLIRPQQKKEKDRKKMISQLEKNDKVVTVGGIHGIVLAVNEATDTITIKTADSTKLEMSRSSVQNKIVPESKTPEKKEKTTTAKKK